MNRRSDAPGRTKRVARVLAVVTGVAVLTAFVPGCSSDKNPAAEILAIPCLSVSPSALPEANRVVLQTANATCDAVDLDVTVTDVTNLFSARFTLTYPSNVLRLNVAAVSEFGSVLASGGVAVGVQIDENPLGTVKVGISILDPNQPGVTFTGGNLLIRLPFVRAASDGSGGISFDPSLSDLFTSIDASQAPQPIPNLQWAGAGVLISQQ